MKNGYFYVWLFCLAAVKQQLTQMFQHKKYTEANGDNDCFGRNINHRTRSENDHANTFIHGYQGGPASFGGMIQRFAQKIG